MWTGEGLTELTDVDPERTVQARATIHGPAFRVRRGTGKLMRMVLPSANAYRDDPPVRRCGGGLQPTSAIQIPGNRHHRLSFVW
jgi:hypothetical protein